MDSEKDRGQRLVDSEVRLSRTRALLHMRQASLDAHADAAAGAEESAWMRGQVEEMIAGAKRAELAELAELGIGDDLIRQIGLGDSLEAAWEQVHAGQAPPS